MAARAGSRRQSANLAHRRILSILARMAPVDEGVDALDPLWVDGDDDDDDDDDSDWMPLSGDEGSDSDDDSDLPDLAGISFGSDVSDGPPPLVDQDGNVIVDSDEEEDEELESASCCAAAAASHAFEAVQLPPVEVAGSNMGSGVGAADPEPAAVDTGNDLGFCGSTFLRDLRQAKLWYEELFGRDFNVTDPNVILEDVVGYVESGGNAGGGGDILGNGRLLLNRIISVLCTQDRFPSRMMEFQSRLCCRPYERGGGPGGAGRGGSGSGCSGGGGTGGGNSSGSGGGGNSSGSGGAEAL